MENSIMGYNTTTLILFTIPVCWGVYELKKLTKLLEFYKVTIDDIIREKNLDDYPLIHKIKLLVDKSNRIIH